MIEKGGITVHYIQYVQNGDDNTIKAENCVSHGHKYSHLVEITVAYTKQKLVA